MTQPGYEIRRDDYGLTLRERAVCGMLAMGLNQVEISEVMGVRKQRIGQLVKAAEKKGVLLTKRGKVVSVQLPELLTTSDGK